MQNFLGTIGQLGLVPFYYFQAMVFLYHAIYLLNLILSIFKAITKYDNKTVVYFESQRCQCAREVEVESIFIYTVKLAQVVFEFEFNVLFLVQMINKIFYKKKIHVWFHF